jgi:hypothetical protein
MNTGGSIKVRTPYLPYSFVKGLQPPATGKREAACFPSSGISNEYPDHVISSYQIQ